MRAKLTGDYSDNYTEENNPLAQVVKTVLEIRSGEKLDSTCRKIKVANAEIPSNCLIVCDIPAKLCPQMEHWDATPMPACQGYYDYHRTYKLCYGILDYD